MFELELINLLNEYKQSATDYDRNKIKTNISKLVKENCDKLEEFAQRPEIEPWAKAILQECEISYKNPQEIIESENDFEIVKRAYKKWSIEYQANNNLPNEECEKIILELINFYSLNRFEILRRVLEINEDENYEAFKNMLKNYLRKHFAQKIENYYIGENFNQLGFFEKRKKKNKILQILEDIGNYNFDTKKIQEVLQ